MPELLINFLLIVAISWFMVMVIILSLLIAWIQNIAINFLNLFARILKSGL